MVRNRICCWEKLNLQCWWASSCRRTSPIAVLFGPKLKRIFVSSDILAVTPRLVFSMMSSPAIPGTDDSFVHVMSTDLMSSLSIRFPLYWKNFCWLDPHQTESWWTRFPDLHFFSLYARHKPCLYLAGSSIFIFDIILTHKCGVTRAGTNAASAVPSASLHFALNFLHGPHCTNVEIISECSFKGRCSQIDTKNCWVTILHGHPEDQRVSREPIGCGFNSAEKNTCSTHPK